MKPRVLAAAQSVSVAGDVPRNIERHLHFMHAAAACGVERLVFPELSLTGYEPDLARDSALHPHDAVLDPLRAAAQELGLQTIVGAPLWLETDEAIGIGALVFGTDGSCARYIKQHLHPGEERVFTPGGAAVALNAGPERTALAICADFGRPEHAQQAASDGAALYAVGALITPGGYERDSALLQQYAARHGMAVLLANHGGSTGGWQSAGRSALWAAGGRLVAAAPGDGDQLLIGTQIDGQWSGRLLAIAPLSQRPGAQCLSITCRTQL